MTYESTNSEASGEMAPTTLGGVIHARRRVLGLSLQALGEKVGCARSYLSMIETGVRGTGAGAGEVSNALLVRLEGALDLAAGTLTRRADWAATPSGVKRDVVALEETQRAAAAQLRALLDPAPAAAKPATRDLDEAYRSGRLRALVTKLEGFSAANVDPGEGTPGTSGAGISGRRLMPVQVPLINSVAAGYPREFTDLSYPARMADEYISSPEIDDADAFAARVVGDSMLPEYREGDIVVFSPARPVKSGSDCFVRLERDDQTTFKRVMLEQGPGGEEMIRLVPLNIDYPSRLVKREDVAFMCPAASVTRKL